MLAMKHFPSPTCKLYNTCAWAVTESAADVMFTLTITTDLPLLRASESVSVILLTCSQNLCKMHSLVEKTEKFGEKY